jgi:ABC-type sugar transport system ATPase subunit
MTGDPALLEVRGVSRTFGSTRALRDVHVGIRTGAVHALVGENGAGKSTLGKIIAGVLAPDQGELILRGAPVTFGSPRQALEHGIAIVAQELALVPRLTVAENVFLGVEPRRAGFIDRRALRDRYQALAAAAGFDLAPDVRVAALRIGQRQQVEILRALARDADLIVLDEPTAALAGPEADRLHEVIRGLASRGRTVVLVSHFLGEVLDLSDTITVLRDGQVIRTSSATDETEASLIGAMLGRPGDHAFPERRLHRPDAPVMLRAEDVWAPGVQGVSLSVRAGEIVGLAGLVGAGRSELGRAISGATATTSGRVHVADGALRGGPRGGIDAGVALIPESRKDDGLCLGRPVRENVSLASLPRLSRAGFVRRRLEEERVRSALTRVSGPRVLDAPAVTLSGGNQQKLMFARAMLGEPRVLVADEPTRGIDVGAKHQIHELLVDLAGAGAAILLISSEIEEILGLSHRVLVMRAGRIVAELSGEDMNESAILNASFGMVPTAA